MAKKKKCPEPPGCEKWAVPFADFFSLLLALFIALYAIAAQNKDKLKQLSKSFVDIFELPPPKMNIIPPLTPEAMQNPGQEYKFSRQQPKPQENKKKSDEEQQQQQQQQQETIKMLMKQLQSVSDVTDESGVGSDTEIVMTDEGTRIRMLNTIVFDDGSAQLNMASKRVLDALAPVIKSMPNDLKIEGYTANTPLPRNSIYPSNWELSAARASSVARYFIEQKGVDPKRFSVIGYADTRPLSFDDASKRHFLNQRVEITLMNYEGIRAAQRSSTVLDKAAQ